MKKLWPLLFVLIAACKQKEYNADTLVKNALVYTVDSTFSTANAFVISNGKIIAVGNADTLEQKYFAKETIDAGGKPVYPGFIDAHAHFYEYGLGLQEVKLVGSKSWNAIVDTVSAFARKNIERWI